MGLLKYNRREFLRKFLSGASLVGTSQLYSSLGFAQMLAGTFWKKRTPVAADKGTLLDTYTYQAASGTENNNYGTYFIVSANGTNGLSSTTGTWTPAGSADFHGKTGPLDASMPGYGETIRLSYGSFTRGLNSGVSSGTKMISSSYPLTSYALFNSGQRTAVCYKNNSNSNYYLSVWDSSTLPYTLGNDVLVTGGKVCVVNDSMVVLATLTGIQVYTVSGTTLTLAVSTTAFDSNVNSVRGICTVDWDTTGGTVLVYYTTTADSSPRARAVRVTSTTVTPYGSSGGVILDSTAIGATSNTIIWPIPYYRAFVQLSTTRFKILKCSDWSTWDGSIDGTVYTMSSALHYICPWGSSGSYPRFYGQRWNGSSDWAGRAMYINDVTIVPGTELSLNNSYAGSATYNAWSRM